MKKINEKNFIIDIHKTIKDNVIKIVENYLRSNSIYEILKDKIYKNIAVERIKQEKFGDFSTNSAMIIASSIRSKIKELEKLSKQDEDLEKLKLTKSNPNDIANDLKLDLERLDFVENISVASSFINISIKRAVLYDILYLINNHQDDKINNKTNNFGEEILDKFFAPNIGKQKKVNIEYVSANPTGPLHIGHARGAVVGDAIASLLKKCNFSVTKEYYINDAGSQIDVLVNSVMIRYQEVISGKELEKPESFYPGEYLIELAKDLASEYENNLDLIKKDNLENLKKIVIEKMMFLIKKDLASLSIKHDVFFSENKLHQNDLITKLVEDLKKRDLVYWGKIDAPQGKKDANWSEREQLLFRSTRYGDDIDRPITKSDNEWSYFGADVAYAADKINRGFDELIYILGIDHKGYLVRIKAIIDALSNSKIDNTLITTALVNCIKDKNKVKMSKRAGNLVTVKEVVDEVGADAMRFMMISRDNESFIDFDLDLMKQQSNDNPVFYIKYGFVRSYSILNNALSKTKEAYNKFIQGKYDPSLISTKEEVSMLKLLALYPHILKNAAKNKEPQRLINYLIDITSSFHSMWSLGKVNNYRFIVENNPEITAARLAFVYAIYLIIKDILNILSINIEYQM